MQDKRILDIRQGPLLFDMKSSWLPPSGPLPDLRNLRVAIDTETRDDGIARGMGPGWPYGSGHLAGISIAWLDHAIYVPVRHPDTQCRSLEEVIPWISSILERCEVVFHNLLYDMGWLRQSGVRVWPQRAHDTQYMAVLLDENWDNYSLDNCCTRAGVHGKNEQLLEEALSIYGVPMVNGTRRHGIWQLPAAYVGPYAEQDAVATLALVDALLPQVDENNLMDAYQTEVQLAEYIHLMRDRGIRISQNAASIAQADFRAARDRALAEIGTRTLVRVGMADMNSPMALARVFDAEGLEYPRTPKTGQPSFQRDWLEGQDHWLPGLVRQARRMNDMAEKFIGTYIMGFSHLGRVHAEIHQLRDETGGTRTFRFSYSSPPLQQMPARYDESNPEEERLVRLIRSIFLPESGEVWGALDYCFSDDTEVLTARGFVLFKELQDTDLCAQVDPDTKELSYASPISRQTVPYSGKMVHIHGGKGKSGGSVDLMVTPNHRCLVYSETGQWSIMHAQDWTNQISYNGKLSQLGAASYSGVLSCDNIHVLQLAAAIQADAAIRTETIRWRLEKTRKIERLHALLDQLAVPFVFEPAGKQRPLGVDNKSTTNIKIADVPQAVWSWLDRKTRTFSPSILELCAADRRAFLDEIRHWDGTRGIGSAGGYASANLTNVDIVHRLAITSGMSSVHSGTYQTKTGRDFAHTTWRDTDRTRAHLRRYPEYDGIVYCVTMPLSTVVVRRNGRVMVTGQSQQEPRLAVHYASICKQRGAEDAVAYYRDNAAADFHRMVADMAGIDRWSAKIINLSLMYGMGLEKLVRRLRVRYPNMTDEEGAALLAKYHERVPWVRGLSDFCSNRAARRGRIKLIDGATCHFDTWAPRGLRIAGARTAQARTRWPHASLERVGTHKAMNRLVQGSAARQTKRAMLACGRAGLLPLIQLHDEIGHSLGSWRDAEIGRDCMLDAVQTVVPMKVDVEMGASWGQAKHKNWDDAARESAI